MISNIADRNGQLQLFSTDYSGGLLEVWGGEEPQDIQETPTGTMLFSFTLPDPAFTTPSNASINKSGVWKTDSAAASGAPTFFRIIAGTKRTQGTASMNVGAEMIISDPDDPNAQLVLANRAIEVISVTVTQP